MSVTAPLGNGCLFELIAGGRGCSLLAVHGDLGASEISHVGMGLGFSLLVLFGTLTTTPALVTNTGESVPTVLHGGYQVIGSWPAWWPSMQIAGLWGISAFRPEEFSGPGQGLYLPPGQVVSIFYGDRVGTLQLSMWFRQY